MAYTVQWPSDYDTFDDIIDGSSDVDADWGNKMQDIAEAMEKNLGLSIGGGYANLAAWLTVLENIVDL